MLGARTGSQDRLFYAFDLDAVVPRDHLLRKVDSLGYERTSSQAPTSTASKGEAVTSDR